MYFANCKKIAEDVDRRKITLNGFSKGTLEVLVRICFDRQVGTFTKSAVCLKIATLGCSSACILFF